MTRRAVKIAELRREIAALDATSRTVTVGPVRLHVLDYGGPSAVPALVVPGVISPAITWDFAARGLRPLLRPYVLDLRGRGLSDAPATGYALEDYAGDVRAVVAELGLERPVLVGHSLGARVAAAASLGDPGLARALVLVDPPLSGPGSGLYPLSLESFLDGDFGRRYPRWLPEDAELWERWLPTCATAAVVATHRGFDEDGFLPLWHRLRGPLALIHGADSQMITAAAAEELAEANDAAAVISVPDSGHMAPWDNPEGFVAVLRRVVQMLTAPVERKP